MQKPQVDILLATYQGAHYLDGQIQSLLAQTYPHIRILIRDDGSQDATWHLLQAWAAQEPDRIVLLPDRANLGIKGNFSRLMEHAQAPYICFSDQDDMWFPDKVKKSLERMLKLEDILGEETPILIHTDLKVVDEKLDELSPSFWRYTCLSPQASSLPRLLTQNMVTGCTMCINRALLERAKPIPQAAVMHDWWVALVASCFGQIDFLEEASMLYRQHLWNDTGAKSYSLTSLWNKKSAAPKRATLQSFAQAESLMERYRNTLTERQKTIIESYYQLPSLPYWRQKIQLLRHGFTKHGFWRNMKNLLDQLKEKDSP